MKIQLACIPSRQTQKERSQFISAFPERFTSHILSSAPELSFHVVSGPAQDQPSIYAIAGSGQPLSNSVSGDAVSLRSEGISLLVLRVRSLTAGQATTVTTAVVPPTGGVGLPAPRPSKSF